jgi:hypothetical protein
MPDAIALRSPEEHGFYSIDNEKFMMMNLGLSDERKEKLKDVIDTNCTLPAQMWWEGNFNLQGPFFAGDVLAKRKPQQQK